MQRHLNDLAADLRHPATILGLEKKDAPRARSVLTLIALGTGGLRARLTDLCAVTVGALDRNGHHPQPPRADWVYGKHTGKLPICNITARGQRSTRLRRPRPLPRWPSICCSSPPTLQRRGSSATPS